MALRGYTKPNDPLEKRTTPPGGEGGGTVTGKYSARTLGRPSDYDVVGRQRLNRDDVADPFVKPASKGSYESDFAGAGSEAPPVGEVRDGRGSSR
jgi:hypothetical protein